MNNALATAQFIALCTLICVVTLASCVIGSALLSIQSNTQDTAIQAKMATEALREIVRNSEKIERHAERTDTSTFDIKLELIKQNAR